VREMCTYCGVVGLGSRLPEPKLHQLNKLPKLIRFHSPPTVEQKGSSRGADFARAGPTARPLSARAGRGKDGDGRGRRRRGGGDGLKLVVFTSYKHMQI
jgi:hypothetical protein